MLCAVRGTVDWLAAKPSRTVAGPTRLGPAFPKKLLLRNKCGQALLRHREREVNLGLHLFGKSSHVGFL